MIIVDWLRANAWPILLTILASTGLRSAARALIEAIAMWTKTTPGTADDEFVAKWGGRIDMVLAVLEVIRRVPFGLVVGPLPRTQPIASVAGRATIPPMQPISAPPRPSTTLKLWPMPEVIAPEQEKPPK